MTPSPDDTIFLTGTACDTGAYEWSAPADPGPGGGDTTDGSGGTTTTPGGTTTPPGGETTSPGGGEAAGGPSPEVSTGGRAGVKRSGSTYRVDTGLDASCPADGESCTVALSSTTAVSTACAARTKTYRIGTARFTVAAGASRSVTFTLSRRGRQLLRQKKRLRVKVRVTVTKTGAPTTTRTRTITIKLPRG